MSYINISISTYAILFLLHNSRILFLGEELDNGKILGHLPKILLLDIFLKIPSLESWLDLDGQNLKILIDQSLVVIFLTREYFNWRLHWLESITGIGFDFIYSYFEPTIGKLEQQKRIKEKIKIVKENKSKTLNLSYSNLRCIPKEIFKLTHLKELNLNGNEIRKIPKEIVNLNNLEVLGLNNNKLSAIPSFIGQLPSLKALALSSNNLKELPSSFGQLPNLNQIFLSDNKFTTFPLCLLKLDQLKSLSLSYNQISKLPEQLTSMPNLRCLYISFNKIDDDTFKKSHVYRSIASKPTHVFNRDTGEVEINEERLIIYHRVAEDSSSIFKSEFRSLTVSGIVKIVLLSIGIGLFLG